MGCAMMGARGLLSAALVAALAGLTEAKPAAAQAPVAACEAMSPMTAVKECYGKRLVAMDEAVDRAYARARAAATELDTATGRGTAVLALEESQALWRAFRRANCLDLRAALTAGGSGTGVFAARCAITMTDRRIAELEEIASGAHAAGDGPSPLLGTVWRAEDIDGGGVIDAALTSLRFEAPDKVGGSGGCNRFFGSVSLDGDRVSFGPFGSTRRACPQAVMDQEQRFFATLEKVQRWEIREGLLRLFGEDGRQLVRMSRLQKSARPD